MGLSIEFYFAEASRHWNNRQSWVRSRDFYEMWEKICQPKPFYVTSQEFDVLGKVTTLPPFVNSLVAFYNWSDVQQCAILTIEADDWDMVWSFKFNNDGSAKVEGPEKLGREMSGLTHGEQMEVMYDVVAYLKKKQRKQQLRNSYLSRISKSEFIGALDHLDKHYDELTLMALSRLEEPTIQALMNKAIEDSPCEDVNENDELFRNTVPGLEDGLNSLLASGVILDGPPKEEFSFRIPSQTNWWIVEQLRCIAEARRMVMQYETICRIPFQEVAFINPEDPGEEGEYGIKFKVKSDLPVVEGDTLTVFSGSGEQEGQLTIDIYDGVMIYGRLQFDDSSGEEMVTESLWALPVPSSAGYLAEAMDHLADAAERGGKEMSPATRAILGIEESHQWRRPVPDAPKKLDQTQMEAWAESTDDRNSVVLVQGPPGTGKTAVLEEVLRTLVAKGYRILVAAPSNAAVDNLVRRVTDLPILRIARQKEYISPDIAGGFWEGDFDHMRRFAERVQKNNGGSIFAGTQVSLVKSKIINEELGTRGYFDVIVFDEAGMTRIEELLLCTEMAKRAVLFGDHRQLLPFPLPQDLMIALKNKWGGMPRLLSSMLERSALEWMYECRGFHTVLLRNCYRCQNPRLIRFSSMLFYNAAVRTSAQAEYYRLPERERRKLYPESTLMLYRTSLLPNRIRAERIVYEGQKPGIENRLEAELCAKIVENLAERYPLAQITVIVPYRRQVRLIRYCLNHRRAKSALLGRVGKGEWEVFLSMRISTVDSFQGGESDAVVISYVRSNQEHGVGFVDEPNRINVAHTRCRKELIVVGDFECLKASPGGRIFNRMERAYERDGSMVNVTMQDLAQWNIYSQKNGKKGVDFFSLKNRKQKQNNIRKKNLNNKQKTEFTRHKEFSKNQKSSSTYNGFNGQRKFTSFNGARRLEKNTTQIPNSINPSNNQRNTEDSVE